MAHDERHGQPDPGVLAAAEAFLASVVGFDPLSVSVPDCARVAKTAARVERAASCVRVLAGARAVDAGAHKEHGVADPAAWLARQGGTTGAEARQSLSLAGSLDELSATKEALLSGAISLEQAKEIARAEEDCPGAEEELVEAARDGDLTEVRDAARERRLASKRPEDLHAAQQAARRLRHWRDGLGMIRIDGALPPETGIPLVTRIEREALALREEAKTLGDPEPFGAYGNVAGGRPGSSSR